MEIKEYLRRKIAEAAGVEAEKINPEHPQVEEFGDYSSNIAMVLAKELKRKPGELAQEIADKIHPDEVIEKITVAGGGFINISIKFECLIKELQRVLSEAERYGMSVTEKHQTAVVDYSAPNIAKPFGIGHLRSTIIGQALYNLYKAMGYKVIGDNHLGDWGTQFGKLLYMINRDQPKELSVEKLEELYVKFHQEAKINPEMEAEARLWFKRLEDGDQTARELWQTCKNISITEFKRIYELLGINFDNEYGESFYEDRMPEIISDAKAKSLAKQSNGAWVIDIPGFATPLMLVKSDGGTTYATRDLATIKFRMQEWQPSLMIYEVGTEQTLHFNQVFAAAKMLGYITDEVSMVHTRHGLYLAQDGKKFATREGKTIKLEQVLDEAIQRAKKLGDGDEDTAKMVGIGAIKYYDLSHNIQSNIVFDWDKIMALEGNSGPYLQYTYARIRSVIRKSKKNVSTVQVYFAKELNPEESAILRHFYKYTETVEEAAMRYAPNLVAEFLYELAQRYNTFYNKHSILGGNDEVSDEDTRDFRLALSAAVGQILTNGLKLLGIEAPGKM